MSNSTLKYFWLIVLSTVWLEGTFLTIERFSTNNSVSYAEVANSTGLSVFDIEQKQTLHIYQTYISWLSLLIDNNIDNSDYQILPRPEQTQFGIFFKIISYQQNIASLRLILSLN